MSTCPFHVRADVLDGGDDHRESSTEDMKLSLRLSKHVFAQDFKDHTGIVFAGDGTLELRGIGEWMRGPPRWPRH